MNKDYVLTIEFRYTKRLPDNDYNCVSRKIIIAYFDKVEYAMKYGNDLIKNTLSKHFTFNDKFDYLFGIPSNIVTNWFSKDKVQIFLKIEKQYFTKIEDAITQVKKDLL